VEDRRVESSDLRELGIDVQWVAVTGQAIDGGLLGTRLVGDHVVGLPVRRLVESLGRGTALAAEPTRTAREDARLGCEQRTVVVGSRRLDADDGRLALVPDLGEFTLECDLRVRRTPLPSKRKSRSS
jgi:hypothetical protein